MTYQNEDVCGVSHLLVEDDYNDDKQISEESDDADDGENDRDDPRDETVEKELRASLAMSRYEVFNNEKKNGIQHEFK